ncbi:MAG: methyltransferase protein [Sphingobacteriaceae bacterium]|jgi:ubiquinone/menaquinone biosynthesis C-methylase UbiE|nr:methyltransferase protein [Sphingobacteriaceae bacterium]
MNIDYDPVAPFYDRLAALVFGKSQVNAQKWLLQFIKPESRVLIVGGGSGWILEEIAVEHQQGLHIVYVEKSAKMLALSQQRSCGRNLVEFVHSDISNFKSEQSFDAVFTGFLFDNFPQQLAGEVFNSLSAQLLPGGLWLYADFEQNSNTKTVHKLMLKAMYWLFRVLCKVETSQLPHMNSSFEKGYETLKQRRFYSGFITSRAYRKVLN